MIVKKRYDSLKKYTILYVEDNEDIAEEIEFFLNSRVGKLYSAKNGQKGIDLFKEHHIDIIITDIQMPLMNGLDMIKLIREIDSEIPIIITTAFNENDYLVKAINMHVDGYLIKPFALEELMHTLQKVIEPIELKKELVYKNEELSSIILEKTNELEKLYNYDPITGLSNFLKLGEEIQNKEYSNLILLDISNFSAIGKHYGKEFINEILKSVGESLKLNINDSMRLFKTESDRFVILTKVSTEQELEEFCKQIIGYFDMQCIICNGIELKINFSIGIAAITDSYYPLINAEHALELGKEVGGRYYSFYDDSQKSVEKAQEAIRKLTLTKALIEDDKIEPFFQAIADIQTGKIVKYEVLARGNYDGEMLSPYEFIGPAERLGLIGSITRMMINKSFSFFEGTDYSFSINLTQRDLLDEHLISFLHNKLQLFKIEASRVTFEILETVTIGNYHEIISEKLAQMKQLGFTIAIDDFGVDNSNFSRLLDIDFDYLKLDGIFVKDVVENKKDRTILCAIAGLAKGLGIKTIAEYVSNKEILEIVKDCGVDMAQGFYISKPLSADQFLELIEATKEHYTCEVNF